MTVIAWEPQFQLSLKVKRKHCGDAERCAHRSDCSAVRHDAAAHFTATNGTQRIHKHKQALHIKVILWLQFYKGVLRYTHAKLSLLTVLTKGDKNNETQVN